MQTSYPNSWFVREIWKTISPKATKDDQQKEKLVQKGIQRSGKGFSQTRPRFSFLIVIVEHNLGEINIIFLISHLADTLLQPIRNFVKKIESMKD